MSPSTWMRLSALSAVAAAGLLVFAWADEKPRAKSYALLIGVKDYGDNSALGALKYTENDAEELAKVLDKPGSPFRGNVTVLTSSRGKKDKSAAPTAANVRKAVAALIKGKKTNETVLVALSGHGVQLTVRGPNAKDKEKSFAYFCPQDADLAGVDYETGRHDKLVLLSDLLGDLSDCGAGTKILLMDACRNDRTARSSIRVNKDLIPEGVLALFSCKTGQFAFETDKLGKGHGVFFYHVIDALKGTAKNNKGQVTWSRLVEHVTDRVVEDVPKLISKDSRQTPHEIKNFAGSSPVLLVVKNDDAPKEVVVKEPPKKAYRTHAVLVGVSEYADKQIKPRRHADADVKALYDVLTSREYAAVDPADVTLLLGSEDKGRNGRKATGAAFLHALKAVAREAKPQDVVLVAFVGQGGPLGDDRCYFLADSTFKSRNKDAVTRTQIEEALKPLKAKRVCALLDVDFTGYADDKVPHPALGPAPYREFLGDDGSADRRPLPGRVGFLATDGLSPSLDLQDHGLFTQVILDGLKGGADAAGYEPDGIITTDELARYVNKHLPELVRKHGKTTKEKQQEHHVPHGRSPNFLLTGVGKTFKTHHARLEAFEKLSVKDRLSAEQADEGRSLLQQMPAVKKRQNLRKAYQQYVDGKSSRADFAEQRKEILAETQLPETEADAFASDVLKAIGVVKNRYVREVNGGELAGWAIRELYAQAEERIPAAVEERLAEVKKIDDQQLRALLSEARRHLGRREDLDGLAALRVALRALGRLDGQTTYVAPQPRPKTQDRLAGTFTGVGVQFRKDRATDYLLVVTPFLGGPASKAGLYAGDLITEIVRDVDSSGKALDRPERTATRELSVADAVALIQGKSGTKLTVVVQRDGADKPLSFLLTRGTFNSEAVLGFRRKANDSWDFMIDPKNKIGYVRPASFSEKSFEAIKAVMQNLIKMEGLKGFVLDLRFHKGGLFKAVTELTDLFIDDGVLVSSHPRGGADKVKRYVGKSEGSLLGFPMVCLINGATGSGSETLAAALQDHQRALIVGERSSGLATIRDVTPLQLKDPKSGETVEAKIWLTVAALRRPNGDNLNRNLTRGTEDEKWGVVPDKVVRLTLRESRDLSDSFRRHESIEHPDRRRQRAKELSAFKDRQLDAALGHLRGQIKLTSK